jgi:hypothetical protein
MKRLETTAAANSVWTSASQDKIAKPTPTVSYGKSCYDFALRRTYE